MTLVHKVVAGVGGCVCCQYRVWSGPSETGGRLNTRIRRDNHTELCSPTTRCTQLQPSLMSSSLLSRSLGQVKDQQRRTSTGSGAADPGTRSKPYSVSLHSHSSGYSAHETTSCCPSPCSLYSAGHWLLDSTPTSHRSTTTNTHTHTCTVISPVKTDFVCHIILQRPSEGGAWKHDMYSKSTPDSNSSTRSSTTNKPQGKSAKLQISNLHYEVSESELEVSIQAHVPTLCSRSLTHPHPLSTAALPTDRTYRQWSKDQSTRRLMTSSSSPDHVHR